MQYGAGDDGSGSDDRSIRYCHAADDGRSDTNVNIVSQMRRREIFGRVPYAIGAVQHTVLADSRVSINDNVAVMVQPEPLVEDIFGNLYAKTAS